MKVLCIYHHIYKDTHNILVFISSPFFSYFENRERGWRGDEKIRKKQKKLKLKLNLTIKAKNIYIYKKNNK